MSNKITLNFGVSLIVEEELADELGKELAAWLEESWFNGEDVLKVEYNGHSIYSEE